MKSLSKKNNAVLRHSNDYLCFGRYDGYGLAGINFTFVEKSKSGGSISCGRIFVGAYKATQLILEGIDNDCVNVSTRTGQPQNSKETSVKKREPVTSDKPEGQIDKNVVEKQFYRTQCAGRVCKQ